MSLINQSRKTLLFNEKIPWVKKDGSEDLDVPMGCFDGAEVCELVVTFMLNKLKNVFQNNTFGLYRDDGLAFIKVLPGPEIERLEKNVVKHSRIVYQILQLKLIYIQSSILNKLLICKKAHICPKERQIIHQFT